METRKCAKGRDIPQGGKPGDLPNWKKSGKGEGFVTLLRISTTEKEIKKTKTGKVYVDLSIFWTALRLRLKYPYVADKSCWLQSSQDVSWHSFIAQNLYQSLFIIQISLIKTPAQIKSKESWSLANCNVYTFHCTFYTC